MIKLFNIDIYKSNKQFSTLWNKYSQVKLSLINDRVVNIHFRKICDKCNNSLQEENFGRHLKSEIHFIYTVEKGEC